MGNKNHYHFFMNPKMVTSALPAAASGAATGKLRVGGSYLTATRSEVLFGHERELLIEHAGSICRLRITQNNKLILTK
jgi:hypothetical protein